MNDNRRPFDRPAGYDPQRYELLRRTLDAGQWDALRLSFLMPNGKSDTNNCGPVSTDHIGANHAWPAADYARREGIFQDHVAYTKGLLYFLSHEPTVPAHVRDEVSAWGWPRDEFVETDGFPHELYVREARRLVGEVVMTEHHCRRRETIDDSVGLAAYTMDSHHCRRLCIDGRAVNEGNVEVPPTGPYPISYRALIPRRGECGNLLVPWCLSASHIAFGSIRMEPVGMVLGQSAATAACLALGSGVAVQDADYSVLRQRLEADGQVLDWPSPEPETCLARLLV